MKTVIALSGGLDSAVMLAHLKDQGRDVTHAISFYRGAKSDAHAWLAACRVAKHYAVEITRVDLSPAFAGFKSTHNAGVPFRNGIFMAVAAGYAKSVGAMYVAFGVHQEEPDGYPDCRIDFLRAMGRAVHHGTAGDVGLIAPFQDYDKAEIVRRGLKLGVPLSATWSCYGSGPKACGRCGACRLRIEAFRYCGCEDPIEYETRDPLIERQEDNP